MLKQYQYIFLNIQGKNGILGSLKPFEVHLGLVIIKYCTINETLSLVFVLGMNSYNCFST